MRANPEVVRYLGTGRTSTPIEVRRSLASGRCAAMACGPAKRSTAALLSVPSALTTRSIGQNRKSSIRSTDPFGGRALRPKRREQRATGCSSIFRWPGLRALFGPTIFHRNTSLGGSQRYTSAHPSRAVPPLSVGCITGREQFDPLVSVPVPTSVGIIEWRMSRGLPRLSVRFGFARVRPCGNLGRQQAW